MSKNRVNGTVDVAEPAAEKRNGKAAPERVTIPGINLSTFTLRLVGDSPLICHAWDEKTKAGMLDKQMGKAKQAKEAKDPFACFARSMYWLTPIPAKPAQEDIDKARFGFPAVAFKSAAVDACSHVDGVTKVEARGAFHIQGDMVEIDGRPEMREDMVRVGMGTADIRHRGAFSPWAVTLTIRHNVNVLTREQIVNLFNVGGFAIGLGEWRPQKNGSMGMFHVE